jgi:ABC-type ATPase involved in cell division
VPYNRGAGEVVGSGRGHEAKRAIHERVEELLGLLGLKPREHHRPPALSTGDATRGRRAGPAQPPATHLADEPTGNLDQNAAEVFRLLKGFHETGGTILLVTHGAAADAYAERVLEMRAGSVIVSGSWSAAGSA